MKLIVYDISGKEVMTLVNQKLAAGSYTADFTGTNYPSGVYYYKLEAEDFSEVRKMILLK
ncbi:MAG: T9SS type A sorting domain-containing protein [Ignavibacteria bacterium]|nr:T9SS type A sorting domain-containing protein [Ignavibacteria bacterium]